LGVAAPGTNTNAQQSLIIPPTNISMAADIHHKQ
jgi:hypothetical protein